MATKKGNEQPGGVNDFTIVTGFSNGYRNREDITVLPPGILVAGSQNVLTNTHQRIGIRKGYTLDGASNADLAPIGGQNGAMGVFDWNTSAGGERNMRAGFLTSAGNDGKLQFRYVDPTTGAVTWTDLLTGLSSIDFNFITFWDADTLQTQLLMVNGESNIRAWSGALGVVASATNTGGIIEQIKDVSVIADQALATGGYGYTEGDVLTVNGGNGDAHMTVLATGSGGASTINIGSAGTGYAVGNLIYITNGTAHPAIRVTSIGGSGEVTGFTILGNGIGCTVTSGIATTGGAGTGLTMDISVVSDGVIIAWDTATDADHGSGYSGLTSYPLTGGTGSNAHFYVQGVTSGTITLSGTETWAELGFTFGTSSTQQVIIDGTTYTYQAPFFVGDTTTLYGVSPNPSAIPADSIVVQAVVTYPNAGESDGLPVDFKNDLIGTLNARVFIGSHTSSYINISAYASFKTWESALTLILSNPPTCFIPQEDALYISGGRDSWYKVYFQLNAAGDSSTTVISLLNTAVQQAAQSQAATNKIANSVVFLSFEPIIESFGPVTDIFLGPQMSDFSFSIVNDMNAYDLTNASLFYFRKFVYVAVPREGLVLVYNMTDPKNPYWEAPLVMPISRFSVIGGLLYGHSNQVSETYKLFDGTNDNGQPILALANFSFNNYGTRSNSKGYNEFYSEGYIAANTTLELGIQFDIDGCATNTYFDILGSDTQIVCLTKDQASLGKESLGKEPLGGQSPEPNPTPKFRVIKTFPIRYFYEDQISFGSEQLDAQWEVVAFGPQLLSGGSLNNNITQ